MLYIQEVLTMYKSEQDLLDIQLNKEQIIHSTAPFQTNLEGFTAWIDF